MKTNLAAFLVLICLGAGILAAEGFSAAAKRRIETRHVSEDFYPRETVPVGRRLAKYAPEDSADCYDLSRIRTFQKRLNIIGWGRLTMTISKTAQWGG